MDGQALELGGRKQRAVLGALLLRVGEVVPDERLIDDVWGDVPPASATHGLEAYVSRLRGVLAPCSVFLVREAGGYRLDRGKAVVDAEVFATLVEDAVRASAAGDHDRAAVLGTDALELWRGPVLSGVPLHQDARARAERLDELRWRALEIRADADLALGRHAEIVGELRRLVEESPYREHLVAQLMLALYHSGRQAEALEVYERTRRALADDLGLQPSDELQRLSGQIVRQEPQLRGVADAPRVSAVQRATPTRRRGSVAALVGAVTAVVVGVTLGLTIPSDAAETGARSAARVAMLTLYDPGVGRDSDETFKPFVDGFLATERRHGLETETIALFEERPSSAGFSVEPEDIDRLSARLEEGDFDLVLWPAGPASPEFLDVVPRFPDTTFVFIDWCCLEGTELEGRPNAVALSLRAEQAAHLAGYLSALMESRRPLRGHREHMVSIVGADPAFPIVQTWVRGFSEGVHRAVPTMRVQVDYSNDFANRTICERIANRQIDAGSGVVFPAAADCGFGALSAAAVRGVWAVGVDEDRSYLGSQMLVSAIKRWDRLVELSVGWYLDGSLPRGEDVELGLADDVVGIAGISPEVPAGIRKKLEREAARLREVEVQRS